MLDTIFSRSGSHLYSIVCCDIKFKSHTNYGKKKIASLIRYHKR